MWLPACSATWLATVSSFSSMAPRRAPWPMRSDEYPAIASGIAETPSASSVSLGSSFTASSPRRDSRLGWSEPGSAASPYVKALSSRPAPPMGSVPTIATVPEPAGA